MQEIIQRQRMKKVEKSEGWGELFAIGQVLTGETMETLKKVKRNNFKSLNKRTHGVWGKKKDEHAI